MRLINLNKQLLILPILLSSIVVSNCSNELNANTAENAENQSASGIDIEDFQYEDVSPQEVEGLKFMREEEKLARDTYNTLFAKWGTRVFNNIAQSEQRHTDAIKTLLDKYEIEDPVKNDTPGVFVNQDLQNLYNTLIAKGDSSLVDALLVGALIEETDILDIQNELDNNVDNADIAFVYDNLLSGSYNHLRAFVKNLSKQGYSYEPQLLSEELFNAIIGN